MPGPWREWAEFPAPVVAPWSDDEQRPFTGDLALSAALVRAGEPCLFAVGPDGHIFQSRYSFDGLAWLAWEEVSGRLETNASIGASFLGPGTLLTARNSDDGSVLWKVEDDPIGTQSDWRNVPGSFETPTGLAGAYFYTFAVHPTTQDVWYTEGTQNAWLGRWYQVPRVGFQVHSSAALPNGIPTRFSPAASYSIDGGSRVLVAATHAQTGLVYWNALEISSSLNELGWSGWAPVRGDFPLLTDDRVEPFVTEASPCAVGNVIFARGRDNYLYGNELTADGQRWDHQLPTGYRWSGWERVGNLQTAHGAAGVTGYSLGDGNPAPGPSRTTWIFARGLDSKIYMTSRVD